MNTQTTDKNTTRQLCTLALFCGLAVIGAQLRIYGSVALDALPAFFAAFWLGGAAGAVVGVVGHMLSALLSGLPMSLPLHLVVAAAMALTCYLAGLAAQRWGIWLAAVAAFVLNAFAAPLVLLFWPGMGAAAYLMLLPSLAMGSAINAFGAAIISAALGKRLQNRRGWKK